MSRTECANATSTQTPAVTTLQHRAVCCSGLTIDPSTTQGDLQRV